MRARVLREHGQRAETVPADAARVRPQQLGAGLSMRLPAHANILNYGYTDLNYEYTDLNYGYTDLNYGYTDLNYGYMDSNYGYTDLNHTRTFYIPSDEMQNIKVVRRCVTRNED